MAEAKAESTAPKMALDEPLVITLGHLKGGVGKTTSTFFLACYFAQVHSLRVLVIDADPLSQTGYSWHRKVAKDGGIWPFDLINFPSPKIGDAVDDQLETGRYDVILIDTGGESDAILKGAIRKSSELIIVCATTDSELDRIPGTFKAAEESAAGAEQEIGVRVLLTKVPAVKNSVEERKAREKIAEAGFEAFDACAHNWQWYREAYPTSAPMDDLGEYKGIGDEIASDYAAEVAA